MRNFTSEKYWYVQQLNIFQDLSDADAYSLERIISDKELKHEERICNEGVYFIKDGRIKITEESLEEIPKQNNTQSRNSKSDEKTETKAVLEQGELFGVFADDENLLNESTDTLTYAECLTEVCVGIASRRDFSFFLKRKSHLTLPLLERTIVDIFTDTYFRGRQKKQKELLKRHNILNITSTPDQKRFNAFNNIAFRTVSSRLALLLQNLASVSDNKGVVLVPRLSIKRISKLIGTSTEIIDKLLETLKQHHVIDKRRGRIQILNAWKLKQISDARMKTLTPRKESVSISDEELDFEALISGQVSGEPESASTLTGK